MRQHNPIEVLTKTGLAGWVAQLLQTHSTIVLNAVKAYFSERSEIENGTEGSSEFQPRMLLTTEPQDFGCMKLIQLNVNATFK